MAAFLSHPLSLLSQILLAPFSLQPCLSLGLFLRLDCFFQSFLLLPVPGPLPLFLGHDLPGLLVGIAILLLWTASEGLKTDIYCQSMLPVVIFGSSSLEATSNSHHSCDRSGSMPFNARRKNCHALGIINGGMSRRKNCHARKKTPKKTCLGDHKDVFWLPPISLFGLRKTTC